MNERRRLTQTLLISVVGISLPFVFWAAFLTEAAIENRGSDWLPPHFHETQQLRWFERHFGGDELLMISYPGCTLGDPRLDLLAAELIESSDDNGPPLYDRVLTGTNFTRQLESEPLNISNKRARARMSGWLLGPDGETSCAIALISPFGKQNRDAAIQLAFDAATLAGISRQDVRVAGVTIESVALNEASARWFVELTVVSLVLCFVLMYWSLRSLTLTFMVFGTAIIAERLSLAWLYFTGTPTDSVTTMTPALVYVLAVSTGVHIANYYRDAATELHEKTAPWQAVKRAWLPCTLATLTTALGLGSLLLSDLTPVQRFGLFAAIGVVSMLFLQFLILPFLLERYPPRGWISRIRAAHQSDPLATFWTRIGNKVESNYALICFFGLILFVICAFGVGQLRATARLHAMLPQNSRTVQDYAWLEDKVGALVPIEAVVRFPQSDSANMLERVRFVERIRAVITEVDGVERTLSAATWLPPLPSSSGKTRNVIRRAAFNQGLVQRKEMLTESGMLREDSQEQMWRISAAAAASDESLDYGLLAERLRSRVAPLIEQRNKDLNSNVSLLITGGIPLIHKIQDQLLADLTESFLAALGVISVVMILVLRSVPAGLLAMLPNLLPTVVIFGLLGWIGPPIEVGSMMTAGAAIGIAVDDTLHFLTWFRRGARQGKDRPESVRFAYRQCATAMVQTSLICGLGLCVFAFSPFVPISRFGWMLAALLGSALIADLVLLPAMLISPLGSVFVKSLPSEDVSESVPATATSL